jgi:membrane protein implicated in regulation of membrane protease activity
MAYWIWLLIGLALVVLEIIIPSFIVIWFGIAALLTGVFSWWLHDLTTQLVIFTLLAVISFSVGWFGFLKKSKARSQAGQSKESVVGEVGIVSRIGGGDFPSGSIRFQIPVLGTDEWDFVSDDPVSVGDRCAIVDVLGNKLKVRKN